MATYMMKFATHQGFLDGANGTYNGITDSYNTARQQVANYMAQQQGSTAEAAGQILAELDLRHADFAAAHKQNIGTSTNILDTTQNMERQNTARWQ
jgi:hypothetical protein